MTTAERLNLSTPLTPRKRYTAEFFERVLRRDSADERAVYVRFLAVVEALLGGPAGRGDAERVATIRTALAAAETLLAEIWGAER
jgi:hypothetical protein